MVGGFALGYLGDRIGRRPAVVAATALFGILTMCFARASSYWSLFSLRFIDKRGAIVIPARIAQRSGACIAVSWAGKRWRPTPTPPFFWYRSSNLAK